MKKHSIVWVIDGAISKQLHKAARLYPALYLEKAGWDVTMIVADEADIEFGNLKFLKVSWPQLYFWGPLLYHFKILKDVLSGTIKCDVFFFQTDYAFFLLPVEFFKKFNKSIKMKVVMDTRSMPMDTASVRGKLRAIVFNMSHFLADKLKIKQTAITAEMVKTVGISPKQLLGIWPSGVNLQDFKKCIPLRVHPGPKEPVRLVYIGVITKERNLENLVDAVILALENAQNVRLDIVGDGEGRTALQKYVSSNGDNRIQVRPPVLPKEIPSVLADADLGVLPFPDLPKMRVSSFIKIFEYMAAGLPIVATKIVAHTEVVKDNSFVFWADDSSAESMAVAIKRACENKEKFSQLGKLSRVHAANYTWEASAQKLSLALSKALVE